jgi:hypothetical protein
MHNVFESTLTTVVVQVGAMKKIYAAAAAAAVEALRKKEKTG